MKLAFYLVNNTCEYTPETFRKMKNNSGTILPLLNKLNSYEWRIYDLSTTSFSSKTLNAIEFMEDYNGEELDGGWWCELLKDYDDYE